MGETLALPHETNSQLPKIAPHPHAGLVPTKAARSPRNPAAIKTRPE